jgi:ribonuclease BN (tRNA processing enzyme)
VLSSAVGKVASRADVRALLLNHFVPVAFDPDALVAETMVDFAGPVVNGEDLLSVDLPNRTLSFGDLRGALGST